MQQRLAVTSILVLALLAVTSVAMIEAHAIGQSQPNAASQTVSTHNSSTTTSTNGGSLLTSGNHNQTAYGDDGNETEHEIETELDNSTMDS